MTQVGRWPEPTDGIVRLRVLQADDAPDHVAGEDDEMRRWLVGGPATLSTTNAFIARNLAAWRDNGPLRNFGIRLVATDVLIGNCEANGVAESIGPGETNISYAIWPQYRGNGYAPRAVELLCAFLTTGTDWNTAIIRVEPANTRSVAVARRAGFTEVPSLETKYRRFARALRPGPGVT